MLLRRLAPRPWGTPRVCVIAPVRFDGNLKYFWVLTFRYLSDLLLYLHYPVKINTRRKALADVSNVRTIASSEVICDGSKPM